MKENNIIIKLYTASKKIDYLTFNTIEELHNSRNIHFYHFHEITNHLKLVKPFFDIDNTLFNKEEIKTIILKYLNNYFNILVNLDINIYIRKKELLFSYHVYITNVFIKKQILIETLKLFNKSNNNLFDLAIYNTSFRNPYCSKAINKIEFNLQKNFKYRSQSFETLLSLDNDILFLKKFIFSHIDKKEDLFLNIKNNIKIDNIISIKNDNINIFNFDNNKNNNFVNKNNNNNNFDNFIIRVNSNDNNIIVNNIIDIFIDKFYQLNKYKIDKNNVKIDHQYYNINKYYSIYFNISEKKQLDCICKNHKINNSPFICYINEKNYFLKQFNNGCKIIFYFLF